MLATTEKFSFVLSREYKEIVIRDVRVQFLNIVVSKMNLTSEVVQVFLSLFSPD